MDALSYVFVCGHVDASIKDVTKVASFFCFKKDMLKNCPKDSLLRNTFQPAGKIRQKDAGQAAGKHAGINKHWRGN